MIRSKLILALLATLIVTTACGGIYRVHDPSDKSLDRSNYVDLAELHSAGAIERRLRHVLRDHNSDLELIIRNGTTHRDSFSVAAADTLVGNHLVIRGNADINGRLAGNLVTLDGNVVLHPGGIVTGDVLVLNGTVQNDGGEIGGAVQTFSAPTAETDTVIEVEIDPQFTPAQLGTFLVLGVVGAFATLLLLGSGAITFAPRQFTAISETVSRSFGRSLLAGFIGQMLLVPTFGVLLVGLIVSLVGILLVPFAVVAFLFLIWALPVGGYLAVAHAMGTRYRRQHTATEKPRHFHALALGLGMLLIVWLSVALLQWAPVIGIVFWVTAFLITWLAYTAGFGAILLSRAGTRAPSTETSA